LLFQRADGALRAALAFRRAHELGRGIERQERDLRLDCLAQVLPAGIVAQLKPFGNAGSDSAEAAPHTLLYRLQCLVARRGRRPRGF
jgi:hypothetical protein